jgi:MATE family multidrug resistance protein
VFKPLGADLRSTAALAWPVIVAELGWMAMGIVDTIMVGSLGPAAIGAVGLGSGIYLAAAIFGMGLLLGLDALVSQAFGARSMQECHRWLLHGIYLALLTAGPFTLACFTVAWTMPRWGLHPSVAAPARDYLSTVAWGTLPLLLYATFRRYLQATHVVLPVMIVLVSANLVNAVVNWLLILGHLGFPALGTTGSAWATVISRWYMALGLGAIILWRERRQSVAVLDIPMHLEWHRIDRLVRLGTPAAMQITAEVGVFAAATTLAGRLDPVSLAAHQVVLNVASVAFMVPLGLSSAGAVRVGHAVGRRDIVDAGRSGWAALTIGVAFMGCSALTMLILPRPLIHLFTRDAAVEATAVTLLVIAAGFQLFDGVQGVATGILRGLGDTRTAMVSNLGAHWLLGLPVGYTLCFALGWGIRGLWVGLSIGLIVVAVILLLVWSARIRAMEAQLAS